MSLANIDWKGLFLGTEKAVTGAMDMADRLLISKKTIPDRVFTPIKDPSEIFGRMFGDTAVDKFWDKTEKRAQELKKGFDLFSKADKGGVMDTEGLPMFNGSYIGSEEGDKLDKIIEHTKMTADHTKKQLDLNKFLFGGGDVASKGVSLLDVARVPGQGAQSRQSRIEVSVGRSRDTLERAVQEIFLEMFGQVARSGYVGGGN